MNQPAGPDYWPEGHWDSVTSGYPEPYVIEHGDDVKQPEQDNVPVIKGRLIGEH
jgi:hypothetical protein